MMLIRSSDAGDEFMGIEKLTDGELDAPHAECSRAAQSSAEILERAETEKAARKARRTTVKPSRRATGKATSI
jgi:hypothetical protein